MPKADTAQGKPDNSLQKTLKGRRFSFGYVNEVIGELKKVTWPTRPETTRLTFLVLSISVAVGVVLGLIDLGFSRLFERII